MTVKRGWYETPDGQRRFVIGPCLNENFVAYHTRADGIESCDAWAVSDSWRHLPGCDSWYWEEQPDEDQPSEQSATDRRLDQLEVRLAVLERAMPRTSLVPGEIRTGASWEEYFCAHVIDPDGWRRDGTRFDAAITAEEFARRWSASTCHQPPSVALQKVLDRIEGAD